MSIYRNDSLLAWMILALGILASGETIASHPFHVCVGQMQYNSQTSRWEVSLRVHPRDLELALTDLHRKSISREDKDFPEHAIDYLENQFLLMHYRDSQDLKVIDKRISDLASARSLEAKGQAISSRSRLEWIGMENERGWLWIHLELIPPESDSNQGRLYLVHRIFLDRIEAQENSVAILYTRTQRSSLQFKKGQSVKPFGQTEKAQDK